MTVIELLDKYNVPYKRIKSDKAFTLFKVGETNVLFWINDNNVFKMKRKWFELLENDCKQYVLFLYDKQEKKYFFIKFRDMNNWLSSGFYNCGKPELYLSKQVLNYTSTLNQIISELKICSK